jgi:2-C-methyl-D-erythritol 4-phosphate cytidylyltransferase
MLKKYAIIVAGGSGSRMQTELPKQFLEINGKPILMHTLEKFAMDSIELILVLNVDYHEYWNNLCIKHSFTIPYTLVKGGNTRYQSVKNALALIKEKSVVAIHDAVRPLIKSDTILEAYTHAELHGNAILAVPSKDSIRKMQNEVSVAVPREDYFLVQTPQVFMSDVLIKAYKEPFRNEFSDDASVVEYAGQKIHLMQGDSANIKITYPEDLLIAQALLKK